MLLVYLNGAGLAIAGWTLEGRKVPLESAPVAVRKLLRYSTVAAVAADMRAGLRLLIDTVLSGR